MAKFYCYLVSIEFCVGDVCEVRMVIETAVRRSYSIMLKLMCTIFIYIWYGNTRFDGVKQIYGFNNRSKIR